MAMAMAMAMVTAMVMEAMAMAMAMAVTRCGRREGNQPEKPTTTRQPQGKQPQHITERSVVNHSRRHTTKRNDLVRPGRWRQTSHAQRGNKPADLSKALGAAMLDAGGGAATATAPESEV